MKKFKQVWIRHDNKLINVYNVNRQLRQRGTDLIDVKITVSANRYTIEGTLFDKHWIKNNLGYKSYKPTVVTKERYEEIIKQDSSLDKYFKKVEKSLWHGRIKGYELTIDPGNIIIWLAYGTNRKFKAEFPVANTVVQYINEKPKDKK